MELLDIYKSVLSFANLYADDNGYVRSKTDKSQFLVKDKALVLPTPEQLRGFNGEQKIVFHPLAEDTIRGESPVLQRLTFCINIRLTEVLGAVGMELLKIVGSPALQTRFTPEQTNVIVGIQEADNQSITNLALVMGELFKTKPDRAFVNIHLRRGGVYKEKKYSRVGLSVFPFYRDLKEGVKIDKIRKKDYPTYIQLHEAILPGLDIPEEYNHPHNGNMAPFFCTLMSTAANIALRLNEIVELFKDEIGSDYNDYVFDTEWLSSVQNVDNLGSMIRSVPVQEGNNGELEVTGNAPQTPPPVAVQAPVYTPPVPVAPQAPAPAGPPLGYGYPVPAPVAQSQAESPYTERGIKFGSIVASNAAAAYAPNMMAPVLNAQAQAEALRQWQEQQIRQWGFIPQQGQQPGFPPPGYGPQPGYPAPPQGYQQPGFPPPGYPQQPGFAPPGYPQPGWMPPGQRGWYGNNQ